MGTPDILLVGTAKPVIVGGLEPISRLHRLIEAQDRERFLADVAAKVRGLAVAYTANQIGRAHV